MEKKKTGPKPKTRVDELGRVCTKCGEYKLWEAFYKSPNGRGAYGHGSRCAPCLSAGALKWHHDNRERALVRKHIYYNAHRAELVAKATAWKREHPEANRRHSLTDYYKNRDTRLAQHAARVAANPEPYRLCDRAKKLKKPEQYRAYVRAACKRWRLKYPEKIVEIEQRRRSAKLRALPVWVSRQALLSIYKEARRLRAVLGVKLHVDHVVPLQHPLVSGLHVPANLRITTAFDNNSKGNKFDPVTFDPADYPCLSQIGK